MHILYVKFLLLWSPPMFPPCVNWWKDFISPQGTSLGFLYLLSCKLAFLVSQLVESACNAGDLGLIPALGRSPGEGKATHSGILAGIP